ncbi:MAG: pyrimidine-nucleoside phosphorylase [Chloroflexi bacterium GWB2_49_20]|nr:MAG: pyrimidine-nucleoside phosphorylase [Chloroflexi bacterium GWB2_49_20]OGN78128.1 MAG: pyrimidine-nucleoside phosphorylase [Chloroflexi bacterium GWC2_49_37]OGN85165.1 MAG: pyrimidine-nucleoside phosphorylase [Chloroflexi bacterium GWD2_49_16]
MRATDIIIKKRDKEELSKEEIEFFIEGFTSGDIPDYQVSAWAMAVLLNGMTNREVTDLTLAMAQSGDTLDMGKLVKISVDKHSTGGVGDKTSLVVLPVVAACGLPVGKMSGHGLGFSGGTLDKMESIPGYRTNLSLEEFERQLLEIGLVLTGQSRTLAPADGKLYALRDVTGTVPAIALIASSIMSKKIAAGAHAIVLDVKTGLGAFMQSIEEARELAKMMVSIGELAGRKVVALLSDMNQPLGYAVGNSLEVCEAIDTLHGEGPADFCEHCLVLSAHMLLLGGIASDMVTSLKLAEKAIQTGTAYEKFKNLVEAQGGDATFVDDSSKFPRARFIEKIESQKKGYVSQVHARLIGEASVILGAGRTKKDDNIDHSVGIVVHRKVGDYIEPGDLLYTLHANSQEQVEEVKQYLLDSFIIQNDKISPLPLFYE